MNQTDILSLKQISEMYDVSYSRLTKATMNREFTFFKQGKVFVKRKDIESWLTKNRIDSAGEIKSRSRIPA